MGCSLGSSVQNNHGGNFENGSPFSSPATSPARGSGPKRKLNDRELAQEMNDEYRAIMAFLTSVPLFMRLPRDQHPILAGACTARNFEAGQVIIKQGDDGHEFFVIREGDAEVLVSDGGGAGPQQVATLGPGDYFGEKALLGNEPRAATVKAVTEISTLRLTREKFQELRLHEHLQFHGRKAVAACTGKRELHTRPPPKKSSEERQRIANALQSNDNLQAIVPLTDERIKALVDVAWMESVVKGQDLITEGDMEADYFYIVQQGSFQVLQAAKGHSAEDAVRKQGSDSPAASKSSTKVATIGIGGSFGELALLYSAPRSATVQAAEDSQVWVIDRNNFKNVFMKGTDDKIEEYVKWMRQCKLLYPLTRDQMLAVANAMVEVQFQKGEVVMKQGEPGTTFYVMYEGEVGVFIDGAEKARLAANVDKKTTQSFGERALLNDAPRAATIKVLSGSAKTLALDRESFNLLLGPLEEIAKHARTKTWCCLPCLPRPGGSRKTKTKAPSRSSIVERLTQSSPACAWRTSKCIGRVHRQDLRRVGLLGCGGFGAVELCEHKDTGATYAMKGLSKGYLVKMGMQDSVMTEKFILQMTNSSFIIALYETYNGSQHLYFLLEPALGGELHSTYIRKGLHGSEKHAKYYVGGVVLAFEHLHERRIIYRDLKPENLMLNEKGHLKVTDMGLSKFVIGKTYTTCGTPDYFAPELLASTGHTIAVDWWTLGILLFELMTGHPPFEADSHMQIFGKVMKGINKVRFPPNVQGPLADLVKAVLRKEPSMRLPMRPGGVQNLKDHAWFHSFDWQSLEALTMAPPYSPTVKSRTDLANFQVGKEDMPPQVVYVDDGTGWDKDFASAN